MSLQFDNRNIRRRNPIRRNNKFFGAEDYRLEMEFSKEYLEQDANQTIVLYEVDLNKTKINDIYVEASKDNIRFKTPVELPVVYEVYESDMKAYESNINKAVYSKPGKLTFSILISTLEENNCDIHRGDYIGIQIDTQHMEYWTVVDDGRVNSLSNKYTIYGTHPYARKIECAPVSDVSEFNG